MPCGDRRTRQSPSGSAPAVSTKDPDTGRVEERQAGEVQHEVTVVLDQGKPGPEDGGNSGFELST